MLPKFKNLLIDKIFLICFKNSWILFVLISLPIILITVYDYSYLNRNLTKIIYNNFQQTATNSVNLLDEKLHNLEMFGTGFTTNPKFRKDISDGKWEEAALIADASKNIADQHFIDFIFLSDTNGNIKSTVPVAPDIIGKNFAYRDWYKGVTSSTQPYVSEVYQRANAPELNIIAVAIPIINDNQQLAGILVFQVRLEHFLEWTHEIKVGSDGFAYIVDQKGQIVASPIYSSLDKIINRSNFFEVKKVIAGYSGINKISDKDNKNEILVAYHPSKYHWGVLVQEDTSKAFKEQHSIQLALAFMFVFILFVNGIFVLLLKKAIVTDPSKYIPK